jgi:Flp pilus assembly pilin Flp
MRDNPLRNWARTIWHDLRGQDMIEYALLAGILSLSTGATIPAIADQIGVVLTKAGSVLTVSSENGTPTAVSSQSSSAPGGGAATSTPSGTGRNGHHNGH